MSVGGLCDNCTKGGLLKGDPAGTIESGGAYLARGPADSESSTNKCLVLLTDVFGLPVKNCKLIADQMATRMGCDVWIPDMFNGTPPLKPNQLNTILPAKPGDKIGILGYLRFIGIALSRLPYFLRNRPGAVDARNHKFFTELREKGFSKIGVFGYCFGGSAEVRLAGSHPKDFDSMVVIHPGKVTREQINAIKIPIAFGCAEEDMSFPTKNARDCEAWLAARKVDDAVEYEFREYKGVTHGFACRPHLEIPESKAAFEGCFEQVAKWFEKTL